jgi:hypothetical protein
MNRPGNLATAGQAAYDGAAGGLAIRLRGLFPGSGFDASELSERELRSIRAKQIDAITRLVPLTMTINLVNVAIVLSVFWNTGSNIFLGAWALSIAATAAMAARSWVRSRRRPPKEASRNAIRRLTVQAFILALAWGTMPVVILPAVGPTYQLIVACLMAGMIRRAPSRFLPCPAQGWHTHGP